MISGQGDLFTELLVPNGEALAAEGMQRAADHADSAWLQAANRIVQQLARSQEPFTTDQVWYRLEQAGVATHEPRALGAVMRRAAKAGLVEQVGYRPTSRPEAHARPIPIWRGTALAVAA